MSLTIEYAAIAQCRPEHVWQVFEQIELWPRWDPKAIRDVHWVSGPPWTKGSKFSIEMLKPMSFKLTPEVLDVECPIYIHLQGKGSGVTGAQHYIFKWMPDQQATELRTLQEFSGVPLKLMGKTIRPALEAGIKNLFARVIEEAETLARSSSSTLQSARAGEATIACWAPKPGNISTANEEESVPPVGDPTPPPSDHKPPIGDPAPAPGEHTPPVGNTAPPARKTGSGD
jgi:hypothetical protein